MIKALTTARQIISSEFQKDLVETFGKRDDKGAIIRPEGEPNGFEPMEDKEKEFIAAQEVFGNREITLAVQPFTIQLFGDIKVSAQDLEALKDLYAGNQESILASVPPIPENVASIR